MQGVHPGCFLSFQLQGAGVVVCMVGTLNPACGFGITRRGQSQIRTDGYCYNASVEKGWAVVVCEPGCLVLPTRPLTLKCWPHPSLNPPQTCSGAATRESRRGAGYENARGSSLGCSAPEALFTKSNVHASVQTNVQTNVQGMFRQQSRWVGLYSRCACRVVEAVAGQLRSLYVVLLCVEMHDFPDCTGVVHTSAQADTQTDVQTNGQCADSRVIGLLVGCRLEAAAGQLRSLCVV
jgi:hypothetical protein